MKNFQTFNFLFLLFIVPHFSQGQLWKQYADSAKSFTRPGDVGQAIEYYNKARNLLKTDSLHTISYARVCKQLAILLYKSGKNVEAEPLFLEALETTEKVKRKDSYDYFECCFYLAMINWNTNELEKAESFFLLARQVSETVFTRNHINYITSCLNLGSFYTDIARYEKAEPLLIEGNQVMEKLLGRDNEQYANSCNNLGIFYFETGQYAKAEAFIKEAREIRQKAVDKNHKGYAVNCYTLATLYVKTGEYGKAEPLLLEAMELIKREFGEDKSEYAMACDILSTLYRDLGQYKKAESLYITARDIKMKVGKERPAYAGACNNLGLLYMYTGEYQKAEPLYREAKEINERIWRKKHPDYAISCENLAILFEDQDKFEMAEPLFLEAKQVFATTVGEKHPDYAESCNYLGHLYWNLGLHEKAESNYLEAKEIVQNVLGKEHGDYSLICERLANVYWNQNKVKKATEMYEEAFRSQEAQRRMVFTFTNENEKLSYLRKKSNLENRFFSFFTFYGLEVDSRLGYDISLSNRNLTLTSSRQLHYAVYNAKDTSLKEKYKEWINQREKISFWFSNPIAQRPLNLDSLETQSNLLEKELTGLSSNFSKLEKQSGITWREIQEGLKFDEAAIEFVRIEYYNGKQMTDSIYYIALVVRKDIDQPLLIPLFENRQLERLLVSGTSLVTISSLYKYNDKRKNIYNLLWRPIEKHLYGIKRIYYAPAGSLYRISFAALPVNDHEVLSDKYQLIQLNTTAVVLDQFNQTIDVNDDITLYGAVKYEADSSTLKQASLPFAEKTEPAAFFSADDTRGNSWKYLPGTGKEITAIRSLGKQNGYSIKYYSSVKASEESVKALNGKYSPAVLHIATHGFFFPDPMKINANKGKWSVDGSPFKLSDNPLFRSGLLLAGANNAWTGKSIKGIEDGILTAYEVSNLYLPNTKLVVLSACETGLGDIKGNEGVYGLQRAFKIAGVENLVMSLWKVPDNTTAEFMQEFYKNIFNKQSISDAFYNAQSVMKNKYRKQPYKWAAWILIR